jgi:hypothetical protein
MGGGHGARKRRGVSKARKERTVYVKEGEYPEEDIFAVFDWGEDVDDRLEDGGEVFVRRLLIGIDLIIRASMGRETHLDAFWFPGCSTRIAQESGLMRGRTVEFFFLREGPGREQLLPLNIPTTLRLQRQLARACFGPCKISAHHYDPRARLLLPHAQVLEHLLHNR